MIVERIRAYEEIGVNSILCAFLHFTDELPAFGCEVIPLREERVRAAATQDSAARKILA